MKKSSSVSWLCLLLISALIFLEAPPLQAAGQEIKPLKEWRGRMAPALQWTHPARGILINQEEVDRLWAAWRISDKPAVDFKTQLLLVGTCTCSHITLHPRLDDKGDLTVGVTMTKDLTEDAAYVIFLVPRQGVRTIKGKPFEAY
jgi:hypothetical protein